MYDLSVLIPARVEPWLPRTIEDILANRRVNTEVIVGLDGSWSGELPASPDVTVVYLSTAIGHRALTNRLCRLSRAKYVMKTDAHCAFDEGFDEKMLDAMQDDWTMVPASYSLHVFDWLCLKCGSRWPQGPTPERCIDTNCHSSEFDRAQVWEPMWNTRTERFTLDRELRTRRVPTSTVSAEPLIETMSIAGTSFLLTRDKYWLLEIVGEDFGPWGQQGSEIACKTWLSGGRLMVNTRTWYAHMYRGEGDFGYPYPRTLEQLEFARWYSQALFLADAWPQQVHPIEWLFAKFANGSERHVIAGDTRQVGQD